MNCKSRFAIHWSCCFGLCGLILLGINASISHATLVDNTLALNPVYYWRFSETTGSTTASATANAKTGTYQGSPTLGSTGAPNFDPGNVAPTLARTSTQAISFANPDTLGSSTFSSLAGLSALSMSFWFRLTEPNYTGDTQWLAGYQVSEATRYVFGVTYNRPSYNPGRLGFYVKDANGNQVAGGGTFPSTFTITDTSWHHVAMTWDGTSLRMYLDGGGSEQTASGSTTTTKIRTPGGLYVGRDIAGTRYLSGQVDELAIFDYKLTATQVQSLYAYVVPEPSSICLFAIGIVGVWRKTIRSRLQKPHQAA